MSNNTEKGLVTRLSRITDRIAGRSSTSHRESRASDNGINMSGGGGELEEYDQFLSSAKALWTLIDQQRLLAMSALHQRMLEYHNNIHVKETILHPVMDADIDENSELMVAQAIKFSSEKLDKPFSVTFGDLESFCTKMKQDSIQDSSGVLWIHMRDLIGLQIIARVFEMHELISAGFQDLRAHSTFIPAFGEALLTTVTCMRENYDFNMYKMYIYVSKNVVITFQAELLPDIMDPELSSPDKLVNHLFENYLQLRKRCLKYGSAFLLYEIALNSLKSLDSSMEFLSYALSYFNKVVHLRLLHRERLAILVKMHMVSSGIRFFKNMIFEGSTNIRTFVSTAMDSFDPVPSGFGRLLHANIIQQHHIPYLMDLLDSYEFVLTALSHQMEESQRLEQKLDATMQLRATNTSILLSLVATIFLPLTFLAGVFGMNFTVDAGYTIGMLNAVEGPTIFYWMCAGCAFASIVFFVYQGWFEIGLLNKLMRAFDYSAKIDDSLLDADEQSAALNRAKEEEERRQEEADARRSFQSATRNVERVMNIRASNVGAGLSRPTFSVAGGNGNSGGIMNPMVPSANSSNQSNSTLLSASSPSSSSSPPPPGTIVIKRRRMSVMTNKRPDSTSSDYSSTPSMATVTSENSRQNNLSSASTLAASLPPLRESMSVSEHGGTADLI